MQKAKKALVVSFVIAGVVIATAVMVKDIYTSGQTVLSQRSGVAPSKKPEINDLTLNVFVGGGALLSLLLGTTYWIFNVIEVKDRLEKEKVQEEIFQEMIDQTVGEIGCQQSKCLEEKQSMVIRVTALEKEIAKEVGDIAKMFLRLEQALSEDRKDLIHFKELSAVEIRQIEEELSNLTPILLETFDKASNVESFLAKNYSEYSIRTRNKIGPFYKKKKS